MSAAPQVFSDATQEDLAMAVAHLKEKNDEVIAVWRVISNLKMSGSGRLPGLSCIDISNDP